MGTHLNLLELVRKPLFLIQVHVAIFLVFVVNQEEFLILHDFWIEGIVQSALIENVVLLRVNLDVETGLLLFWFDFENGQFIRANENTVVVVFTNFTAIHAVMNEVEGIKGNIDVVDYHCFLSFDLHFVVQHGV